MLRHKNLIADLRADLRRFVCLCLMVLTIPLILHPLAEAHAAQNGRAEIICTSFGVLPGSSDDLPIGAPDDIPCVNLCAAMSAGKLLKSFNAEIFVRYEPIVSTRWMHGVRKRAPPDAVLQSSHDIRGPPPQF